MANIKFNIQADYEKVIKLREEIVNLMAVLNSQGNAKGMDEVVKKLNSTQKELDTTIQKTAKAEAAIVQTGKAGSAATKSIANSIKSNISTIEDTINSLGRQIIEKKALIREITNDSAKLKSVYNNSYGSKKTDALSEYKGSQRALKEEQAALAGLQAEQGRAKIKVKELNQEFKRYDDTLKKTSSSTGQLKSLFLKLGGVYIFKELGQKIIETTGQIQMLNVSFTTLLQSKEKADALMAQIIQTAVTTPFQLTDLATGAKQLVAYGFAAEEVNGTLLRLGNVAAALGLPLERLTYLYGTTRTQGRLYQRDMLQFTTSGIPVLQGLANMYGKSTAEINKMVSAGKIGFPEVQKVFEQMTNKGGKFYNLMQEQAKTIPGKISNLKDQITMMTNNIGSSQKGLINGTISATSFMVGHYKQVGKSIMGLVATYGIYKTAVLVAAAVNGTLAKSNLSVVTSFNKVKKAVIALNSFILTNPYVALGAAVATLAVGLWALSDSTTAQERAQKSLNETLEATKQAKEGILADAMGLVNKIRSETSSVYEQVKAWEELIKKYKFFSKYSLNDILKMSDKDKDKLFSTYSQKIDKEQAQENYDTAKKELADLEEKLTKPHFLYHKTEKNFVDKKIELQGYQKELEEIESITKKIDFLSLSPEKQKNVYQEKKATLIAEKDLLTNDPILNKDKGISFIPSALDLELNVINQQLDETEKVLDGFRTKDSVKSKGYWEKQKKDAEEAINDIAETISDKDFANLKAGKTKGIDADLVKKYKTEREKLSQAEGVLGIYGNGKAAEKAAEEAAKEADKYSEQLIKDTEDEIKLRKALYKEIEQADVDSMKEGFDKEMAQLALNHENKLQEIKDKAKELLEAENKVAKSEWLKKGGKEAEFKPSTTLSAYSQSGIDSYTLIENNTYLKNQTKLWQDSLDKYKDFTEKKKEIDKQYSAEYNNLTLMMSSANADKIKRIQAEIKKRWNKELSDLQKASLADNGLSDVLTGGSDFLIGKIKEALPLFHSLTDLTKNELGQVKDIIGNIEFTPKQVKSLKDAGFSLDQIDKILKSIKDTGTQQVDSTLLEKLEKVVQKLSQSLNTLGSTLSDMGGTVGEVGGYLTGLASSFDGLFTVLTSKKGSIEQIGAGIESIMGIVNMVFKQIEENKAEQDKWTDSIAETVQQAALLRIETEGYKEANIFGVDNPYAKAIAGVKQYRAAFDELSKLVSTMENGKVKTGTENIVSGKNVGSGIGLGATAGAALGSLILPVVGTAIGAVVGAIIGGTIGLASKKTVDVFDTLKNKYGSILDPKNLDTFELNPEIIKDYAKLDDATKKIVDNWDAIKEKAQAALKDLTDNLTALSGDLGTTLSDLLVDAFKNGDLYSAMDDFHEKMNDILADIMQQIAFNAAFGDMFTDLENRYKESFGINPDGSLMTPEQIASKKKADGTSVVDNNITDDLIWFEGAYKSRLEIYNQLLKDGDATLKELGYTGGMKGSTDSTRTATAKGIATASQDSVDENNGRLTSIEGFVYTIEQRQREQVQILTSIDSKMDNSILEDYQKQGVDIAKEIREQSIQAVKHLANIDTNTARLENIETHMKAVKNGIENMNRYGLILK